MLAARTAFAIALVSCALSGCGGAGDKPRTASAEPVVHIVGDMPQAAASAKAAPSASAGANPAAAAADNDGAADADRSANELSMIDMQMLSALTSSGAITAAVLPSGSASVAGLATATPASPPAPRGAVEIRSMSVKGSVANASVVVAGMTAGFRRCYQRGLGSDPTMTGKMIVVAAIGPNGEVLSAHSTGLDGLSAEVASCVTARVTSAQFAPPDGGSATVTIPAIFVLSH